MSKPPSASGSNSDVHALDSSFLPLTHGADDVSFPLVHDGPGHSDHHEEEAALEALRAAISGSHDESSAAEASASAPQTLQSADGGDLGHPTLVPAQQVQVQSMDKAVAQLQQLSAASSQLIEGMNAPTVLNGLLGSFKLLVDSNRRQAELVKNLVDSINGRGPPTIDPSLAISYVPRSEYDALKARYDALVSTSHHTPAQRRPRSKPNPALGHAEDRLREIGSSTPFDDDKPMGRKRRSMKLEHLVHKMANRRLGVEYTVNGFDCKGTRELPDPSTIPPSADTSVNGVDEFRPDFRGDVSSATVRTYLDVVAHDCKAAWAETLAEEEPDVDDDHIIKAVHTYWIRLSKRYEEQLARDRGEVHKDELTRRKQNQYRRQQSLVARRAAAFDSSPLNLCKLRALYRTLLTIDFAAMTNERPDPKRAYTEEEWYAYRKKACGARSAEAHEIVDQFWLSPTVRGLLDLLDTYAFDQSAKQRKKGRPKQPAPTFHLPQELWDQSSLPPLRAKDAHGLPVASGGIILFRFHVDERVQEQFPDWAAGLYDNPPVSDEDKLLPNLPDIMNTNAFLHIKPKAKLAREAAIVPRMTAEEIREVLADTDTHQPATLDETSAAVAAAAAAEGDSFDLTNADFMNRGLESIVALASSGGLLNPFTSPTPASLGSHSLLPMSLDVSHAHGPSAGSSVRARRQAKRMMSEVPGGAATPVPKRRKADDEDEEVDISGDASFLDSL